MSTITRRLSVEEIQAVATAFNDRRAIGLLKAIKDNIVQEADLKQEGKGKEGASSSSAGTDVKDEKQKEELALQQQEQRAFVGMAREDKILGGGAKEGEGGEESAGQKSTLERLENLGLVSKGGYIPKDKERINGYKLTDEGYALLAAALEHQKEGAGKGTSSSSSSSSKSNYSSNSAEVPDDSDNYKKKQQVGAFKSEFDKEYK